MDAFDYLQQRKGKAWLVGCDAEKFDRDVRATYRQIQEISSTTTVIKVIIVHHDSIDFLIAFLAAISANCAVFLGDPTWVDREWQEVLELVQPDLILGARAGKYIKESSSPQLLPTKLLSSSIVIPTGGSSGKIRFAIHNWETLTASAKGFYDYFDRKPVNSFCVLPLYHVSGLMQFIRSLITGGKFFLLPYNTLKLNIDRLDDFAIVPENFYISLVPTQLKFIFDNNPDWLSRFKTVFVGGAAAWQDLLLTAKKYRINLALTYGMTETAAQIATLKPEFFLQGKNNSCGRVLPHAKVTIRGNEGEVLDVGRSGIICIEADSLFLGYYTPDLVVDPSQSKTYFTDDIGYLDRSGYLHIIGRNSQKIITGGKNVFPAEVEAIILGTGLVIDVCVVGLPDNYWGQVVVAVCLLKNNSDLAEIKTVITGRLSNFKIPKYWLQVDTLNRDRRGKINYAAIEKLALENIKNIV
jgi:o-succinylbenzoate---CoA ligase